MDNHTPRARRGSPDPAVPSTEGLLFLSTTPMPYPMHTLDTLRDACRASRPWLWRGFIAAGEIALFTSLWKSGKSTLISILLGKMKTGGELAGQPVRQGNVVVITEESPDKWFERCQRLDLGRNLFWFCRPFKGKPTFDEWRELLQQIRDLHAQRHIDLVVIDPLANFSPAKSENESGEVLKALLSLQELTKLGMAVLVAHHPHKGAVIPGQAARGSGVLTGFVDTIIEMERLSDFHPKDRRRRLNAYSRSDETPSTTVIELNAAGTDYHLLAATGELDYERAWLIVQSMLENAGNFQYYTHRDFVRDWPLGFAPPPRRTLYHWLKKAEKAGRVRHHGEGARNDPHRYYLPGMEEKWQQEWRDEFTQDFAADSSVRSPTPDAPPQHLDMKQPATDSPLTTHDSLDDDPPLTTPYSPDDTDAILTHVNRLLLANDPDAPHQRARDASPDLDPAPISDASQKRFSARREFPGARHGALGARRGSVSARRGSPDPAVLPTAGLPACARRESPEIAQPAIRPPAGLPPRPLTYLERYVQESRAMAHPVPRLSAEIDRQRSPPPTRE